MTKHYACEREVERVALGLLYRTLPKREWTHCGHFAAALWILRHRPEQAQGMRAIISGYNQATGVANSDSGGYHHTITQASLRAGAALLARYAASVPLHQIVDVLMDSELGRSDWLLAYWSKPRLFSVAARRGWVEPDLRAFPHPHGESPSPRPSPHLRGERGR
ncbi:MAG TPA: hypothetical protein VNX47_03190 [Nevskia sp.]|nr:hypothetical protein [Nevskia sp.]